MRNVGTHQTAALERLEAQVRRDLATIEAPPAGWMRARLGADGRQAFDVVVIGAGLSGLSIGFGLRRQGIDNFLILDQRPSGREGPWITCARMATLRSPKQLTGPDLGVPSLAFRSWFEAVAGEEAWERLDKIAPGDWMAYLSWYRRVLDLPVRNETRLDRSRRGAPRAVRAESRRRGDALLPPDRSGDGGRGKRAPPYPGIGRRGAAARSLYA